MALSPYAIAAVCRVFIKSFGLISAAGLNSARASGGVRPNRIALLPPPPKLTREPPAADRKLVDPTKHFVLRRVLIKRVDCKSE